jgi:hypothetical protein
MTITDSPRIEIFQGTLTEGTAVEFSFNFDCDMINDAYPYKKWTVLAEKDVKYNEVIGEYYYDQGKGNVFVSNGDNFITVSPLVPGRLFVFFTYRDIKNREFNHEKVFTVYPNVSLEVVSPVVQYNQTDVIFTSTVTGISAEVFFSDISASMFGLSGVQGELSFSGKSMTQSRTFMFDGLYIAQVMANYKNALHNNEGFTPIVWGSYPENKMVGVAGPYGGGTSVVTDYYHAVETDYLVKKNISGSNGLDLDIGFFYQPPEPIAPAEIKVIDKSSYYDMNSSSGKRYWDYDYKGVPVWGDVVSADPDNYVPELSAYRGDNYISMTEINFGDDITQKGIAVNFEFPHLYRDGKDYNVSYTVTTRHYLAGFAFSYSSDLDTASLGLLYDNETIRYYYEQTTSKEVVFSVKPFFYKWFMLHMKSKYYTENKAVKDLATAWGFQMDRLYKDAKDISESIDVDKMNEKFILHYFNTYGDVTEIAQKVGFVSNTVESTDRFDYFKDYNFFDRLERGETTKAEKQEFIEYVKTSRARLQKKGTPKSIELAFKQLGLLGLVVELWTDNLTPKPYSPIVDEVFTGGVASLNTGLDYKIISTPSSTNSDVTIATSEVSPVLEVNTINYHLSEYYLDDNEIVSRGGKKYVVFPTLLDPNPTDPPAIDTRWPNDFDDFADTTFGTGKWLLSDSCTFNKDLVYLSGEGNCIQWSEYSDNIGLPYDQITYWRTNKPLVSAYVTDVDGYTKNFDCITGNAQSGTVGWEVGAVSGASYLSWPWMGITQPYYFYRLITPNHRTDGYSSFKLAEISGFSLCANEPFTLEKIDTDISTEVVGWGGTPFIGDTSEPYIIPNIEEINPFTFDEYMRTYMYYSFSNKSDWRVINGYWMGDTYEAETSYVMTHNNFVQLGDMRTSISELSGSYVYFCTTEQLTSAYSSDGTGEPSAMEYWEIDDFKVVNGSARGNQARSLVGRGTRINNWFVYRWKVKDGYEKPYYHYHPYNSFCFKSDRQFILKIRATFPPIIL